MHCVGLCYCDVVNKTVKIQEFCEMKGKSIPELSDIDWMADFAVNVTALMNELNTKLH